MKQRRIDRHDIESFVQEFRGGIDLYRTLLDKHVYPPFTDPNHTATEEAKRVWNEWMSEPYSGQEPGDLAEAAHDHALDVYNELFAMQTILMNLFTAGLRHLFEQQMASLMHHDEVEVPQVVSPAFVEWAKASLKFDPTSFSRWNDIKELALVANVVKHAAGDSDTKLRKRRPELFGHPMLREPAYKGIDPPRHIPTRMPLGGADLYVTKGDFEHYATVLDEFWQWFLANAIEPEPEPEDIEEWP